MKKKVFSIFSDGWALWFQYKVFWILRQISNWFAYLEVNFEIFRARKNTKNLNFDNFIILKLCFFLNYYIDSRPRIMKTLLEAMHIIWLEFLVFCITSWQNCSSINSQQLYLKSLTNWDIHNPRRIRNIRSVQASFK